MTDKPTRSECRREIEHRRYLKQLLGDDELMPSPKLKLVTPLYNPTESVDIKSTYDSLFDKILVGNPDKRAKLGSMRIAEGFIIMEVDKPIKARYYYIKYNGEYSGLGTRSDVCKWIKMNQAAEK